MSMTNWAEREISAACKRENPDWDGKSFDYGCSCYQSALKAYKSIMKDEHSGFSYSITKNILIKLLNQIPLSPITDEDFFSVERGTDEYPLESDEYLKKNGLKSELQCPRRSSLFRTETMDGKVSYHDNNRCYCVNAECPSDTFGSGISRFIDELYPITMPYTPRQEQFRVYTKSWLTNKNHGDFDVHVIIGYYDQDNNWHFCNRWEYYGDNGVEDIIDPKRQSELEDARLYPVENSIACHIANDITYLYAEKYWGKKGTNEKYNQVKAICDKCIDSYYDRLKELCKCMAVEDEHGVCYMNTWGNQRVIVEGSDEDREELIKELPELKELIHFIDKIKSEIESEL